MLSRGAGEGQGQERGGRGCGLDTCTSLGMHPQHADGGVIRPGVCPSAHLPLARMMTLPPSPPLPPSGGCRLPKMRTDGGWVGAPAPPPPAPCAGMQPTPPTRPCRALTFARASPEARAAAAPLPGPRRDFQAVHISLIGASVLLPCTISDRQWQGEARGRSVESCRPIRRQVLAWNSKGRCSHQTSKHVA